MTLFGLLALAVLTGQTNGQAQECPFERGTWLPFGDKEYWISTSGLDWETAGCSCSVLGGRLARPETASELSDISSILDCLGTLGSHWIGASDLEERLVWRWQDGTEVPEDVQAWYDGSIPGTRIEPSANNASRCVRYRKLIFPGAIVFDEWTWGAWLCDVVSGYICEREVLKSPSGSTCPLDRWFSNGCTEYYIPFESASWFGGKEFCENQGGTLATPRSQTERDFLYGFLDCLSTAYQGFFLPGVYIGASDLEDVGANPRIWRWVDDGSVIPDSEQDFLESDNSSSTPAENCINVRKTALRGDDAQVEEEFFWGDLFCELPARFVCQRIAEECRPPTTPTPTTPTLTTPTPSCRDMSSSSCSSSSSSSSCSCCCSSSSDSSSSSSERRLSLDISM